MSDSSDATMTGLFVEEENPLGTLGSPQLMEKIDELFARGVGEHVALPQIVVVGDQSSGKSSVLEGLTNLPFPRDSGLCTRFATQISFRRMSETSITVSVIPDKNANEKRKTKLRYWSKRLKNLNPQAFSEIMTEVIGVMGLRSGKPIFTKDVLRLEVIGPEQQHFSVVDVPGMFRKTTEGVTTHEDQEMVKQIVQGYMHNRRSIMLAVIPSNVDVATQEILEMAKGVDMNGARTLGVLTKPDLVDEGAEKSVMELIKGRRHRLTLGWCIVRNPGQRDLARPETDRHAIEKEFFKTKSPWNELDKDKVGIGALRKRLQELLTESIRRAFPEVKSEIQKQLTDAKKALEALGPQRETESEQRQFVLHLSSRYKEIVEAALHVKYGKDLFDDDLDFRFATNLVNRNDKFNEVMAECGHTFEFQPDTDDNCLVLQPQEALANGRSKSEHPGERIPLRERNNHPDLAEMFVKRESILKTTKDTDLDWLSVVYHESRGFELGTFDSSLLATTVKKQSINWDRIAHSYIEDIINMAHTFVCKVLKRISPTPKVFEGLLMVLMDALKFKYQCAIDKVKYLLTIERLCSPLTLNQHFNQALQKSRQSRHQLAMEKKAFNDTRYGKVVRVEDAVINQSMSNVDHTIRDVHDVLKAYYEVARKRFTDNVCLQAADHMFVSDDESPLRIFNPEFVQVLSPQMLEEIAGEDLVTKRNRKDLQKDIADLEAGKKILM